MFVDVIDKQGATTRLLSPQPISVSGRCFNTSLSLKEGMQRSLNRAFQSQCLSNVDQTRQLLFELTLSLSLECSQSGLSEIRKDEINHLMNQFFLLQRYVADNTITSTRYGVDSQIKNLLSTLEMVRVIGETSHLSPKRSLSFSLNLTNDPFCQSINRKWIHF